MAIRRVCPECEETVRLPDGTEGRKVKCPECKAAFVVPEEDEPEEPRSRKRAAEQKAAHSQRRRDEEPEGGPNWKLLAGIGVGLVGVIVIGAIVAVFALGGKRAPEVTDAGEPPSAPASPAQPAPPKQPAPKPVDRPPDEPLPPRFRPAPNVRIPADALFTADLTAAPAKVLAPTDARPLNLGWVGGSPTIVQPLPNGAVALARADTITFWDAKADKLVSEVKLENVVSVAGLGAAPDSDTLLVHGHSAQKESVLFGVDVRERKQLWRKFWPLTQTRGQELTLNTSTDGRVAFVGTVNRTNAAGIMFLDPRTGRTGPRHNGQLGTMLGSPDERLALIVRRGTTESDFTFGLWDTVRNATLGTHLVVPGKGVRAERAVAFSPDGRALVFAADSVLYVFEAGSGKLVHKVKLPAPPARTLSFSANGRLLAWYDDSDGRGSTAAYVFDLATGSELARAEVGESGSATAAGVAPDGGTLFVGTGPAVSRYALPALPPAPAGAAFPGSAPRPKSVPVRAAPPAPGVGFTPPAAPVTVPAAAPPTHVIAGVPPRVLSAEDTYLINPLDRVTETGTIVALPNGTVATAAGGSIQLWDPIAGRWEGEIKAPELTPAALVAAPDGGRLFAIARSAESTATTLVAGFDVPKRAELWRYRQTSGQEPWRDLGVSPDGSRVWVGAGFPAVQVRAAVLHAGTGQELAAVPKRTVAPSPDPARGFFVSRDGKVEEYTFALRGTGADAEAPYLKIAEPKDTNRQLHNLRTPVLSPSARQFAFALRNHLIVLETATGKVLHRVELNHPFAFPPVFSPDERYLAWRDGNILSQGGKAGYVFDLTAGREVARFEPLEKFQVRAVAFTADSRSLVVVMGDALLRVPIPPTEK